MNHISSAIDKLLADQEARHSDIIRMGEQIRREREQQSLGSSGAANNRPESDNGD